MKKYVVLVGLIVLSLGGYSFAATCQECQNNCNALDPRYGTCISSCQRTPECGNELKEEAKSKQCETHVTSSLGTSTDCDKLPKEDKDDCTQAGPGSINNKCKDRYSCETLFVKDPKIANDCNLARCKAQKGDSSSYCQCKYVDKGIPLNTSIPFLGNCVQKSSGATGDTAALNAFPTIVSVATRILVTVIMLVSFIMIIVGGIQWSTGNAKDGKAMITKVVIAFALLGAMGAILRLINPNFFK